ncbi:desulfoferrodoxin family protein [Tannockella kyphosi]|uniref:desulfoferrodoxin family protein n=1 Tax=Tannockella kyphosi TaxID=2899121 RepID=UPI0020112DCD|nr:desulfoferrodoxin family protein [Tannockella kyphosi]
MSEYRICERCKNIIEMVEDKGVPIMCCGTKMVTIEANTVEAATEKHIPVVQVNGDLVEVIVGEVEHPMLEEHSITWVSIETTKGSARKELKPGSAPKATFVLAKDEELVAAYAYCNLHGLWKSK